MKTFSRQNWENQYNYLQSVDPILGALLPFEKVLTADLDSIKDTINEISDVVIMDEFGRTIIPNELIKVLLTELNDYGHSLVLVGTEMPAPMSSADFTLKDDVRQALESCTFDIIYNTADNKSYVKIQGKNAVVTLGNVKYVCKHISMITERANSELYLPIGGNTKRIFIAAHSTPCNDCNKKECIQCKNGTIELYDSLSNGLVMTPVNPNDWHNAQCHVATVMPILLNSLGEAIIAYNKAMNDKRENSASQKLHKVSAFTRESTVEEKPTVRVVTYSDNYEEIMTPLCKSTVNAVNDGEKGTHASPVAHEVSGYWRRRSKYDDSMIFVKSFARGGSEEEREQLQDHLGQKQKVYKVK